MSTRTYPYTGWILQPSFKPVEVTFVNECRSMNKRYGDETASGKWVRDADIFPTRAAVVAHGRLELKRMQADLDKRTENLKKKTTTLDKAEGIEPK